MGKFEKEIKIIQELMKTCSLTRTKIVKLLYLLDIKSIEEVGKPITSFQYCKYYYGPYDESIVELLSLSQYFRADVGITSRGSQFYKYHLGSNIVSSGLDSETQKVVDEIKNEYLSLGLDKILEKAYSTRQFQNTKFGEKIAMVKT